MTSSEQPHSPTPWRSNALCSALGLVVIDEPPAPHIYDGLVLRRGADPAGEIGPMAPGTLAHEVAHYLVATDDERAMPEWGLGRESTYGAAAPDLGRGSSDHPVIIEDAARWVQHELCCCLGLADDYAPDDWWAQQRNAALRALAAVARGDARGSDRAIVVRITRAIRTIDTFLPRH